MTTPTTEPKRWQEIAIIWKDNRWLYIVVGLLMGLLVAPVLEQITGDLNALIGNLVPEAIGIIFTVLILEQMARNRDRENFKQDLIRRAGSVVNDVAIDAIEQLRKEGWLTGAHSVLKGANLQGANLENAQLGLANLQQANLRFANLQRAKLDRTNLQQASLCFANLQQAHVGQANLQQADLLDAELQRANLICSNLQQADLSGSNLQQANLDCVNLREAIGIQTAKYDEKTVLPDSVTIVDRYGLPKLENGEMIYSGCWTLETDMTRYTNPEHPDFWEPEWVKHQRKQDTSG